LQVLASNVKMGWVGVLVYICNIDKMGKKRGVVLSQ